MSRNLYLNLDSTEHFQLNILDGQWTPWSIFGDCSPCGAGPNGGNQTRLVFPNEFENRLGNLG
jgi:hypothetical protein